MLTQNDELSITFFNKHQVGNTADHVEKLVKMILVHKYPQNYLNGIKLFHMIYLPRELYTMEAGDNIACYCKSPWSLCSIPEAEEYKNLRKVA